MTDIGPSPAGDHTTVQESISSMEVGVAVGVSESVDTLEDLVDQMEIEISDHGDEGESEDGAGEESLDESPRADGSQQGEKMEESAEKNSEKIRSSTTVSGGAGGVTGTASDVRAHHSEGQFGGSGRRRRHSSTRLDRAEFQPISLNNQLSDDEILELMELLQVRELPTYIHVHVYSVAVFS